MAPCYMLWLGGMLLCSLFLRTFLQLWCRTGMPHTLTPQKQESKPVHLVCTPAQAVQLLFPKAPRHTSLMLAAGQADNGDVAV